MGLIVCTEDFVGQFKIALDGYNKQNLNDCIAQYEKNYIKQILGEVLGQKFIEDIDNKKPVTQIYIDLYESFYTQPVCYYYTINWELYLTKKEIYSIGMKNVLLSFIYYHYISESQWVDSTVGTIMAKNEASNVLSFNNNLRVAERKFNGALESVDAIHTKCFQNKDIYPDFNGQKIYVKYGSII